MDYSKKADSEVSEECEWPNYSTALNKLTETSDNNSTQEDVKVKVEIELKEAENGLIYQPDFYGHLRLVSLNQITSDTANDEKNKSTDATDWEHFHHSISTSRMNEDIIVPTEESDIISSQTVYEHLSNIYGFSKDKINNNGSVNSFQGSVFSSSFLYNSLHKDLQKQDLSDDNQDPDYVQKKKELSSILAEKKRNYRNKIKEENPAMWCAMKQKEACKKREQREEKRFILLEMQRTMHLLSLPETPETENHRVYLGTLKERYPDIWRQLINALSAAEQRNTDILESASTVKKRSTKPVRAYKDIVEAQKKYLYRQRMKLERPDLYEQQKARDSYARSIRRMLKKQLAESQNNVNDGKLKNSDENIEGIVNNNVEITVNYIDSNVKEVHNIDINL